MATQTPIPSQTQVVNEKGILSRTWHQFLNAIFDSINKRLDDLEATSSDHETRIETLEP